jgi:hypothetical protein
MRKILIYIFILLSFCLHADASGFTKSQFIGDWCTNPCYYGSSRRPWNLPCDIKITEKDIQWPQGKKKFRRQYEIVYQDSYKEIFLVKGGDEYAWYAHESLPQAKHKLTFNINHSNEYAKPAVELTEESYSISDNTWRESGSMYITKGKCP